MNPQPSAKRQVSDFGDFEQDDLPEVGTRSPARQPALMLLGLRLIGRWYWIALGLILGLLGACYYLAKTPQQYTAAAALLIKQQTTTVMARDQVDEIDLRSVEAMNTIVARIQSKELLERVAARQEIRELTGLIPPPVDWVPTWLRRLRSTAVSPGVAWRMPPPAELGRTIRAWMGVSIIRGTRLINISITHPVPAVASLLADTIAREYVALIAATSTRDRSDAISMLEKQSEEARTSLRTTGSILASYARAVEASKTLEAQEIEVTTLQRRYLPLHPKMITAAAELKQLQQQFIHELASANEANDGQFDWKLIGQELPNSRTSPDDYLHAARQQLLAFVSVLESEIQSSTLVFNTMLTRIQESSVNQQSADFSAKVSELANPCEVPIGPSSKAILVRGTLGGLACGLLLATLFSSLDKRFHTVAQIASETGAPILGAIAEINPHHLALADQLHRKRHPDAASEGLAGEDRLLVFRSGTSATSYAEMYRSLYASVSRLGDVSQRKITIFSSALPGEGKTLTSANFAAVAASQGRKTLLIDLDLRKPAIHEFFGIPRTPNQGGITECLANLASFEQVLYYPDGHPNLALIVAGKHAPNAGELLESGLLKAILAQACRDFDVVVLDSAPFLAVSDTRIIAPLVHNFCLVAKAEFVPKGAVHRVLEIMQADGIPLSGIVFNSYRECRYLKGQNYSYGYYRAAGYGHYRRYCYDSDDSPDQAAG